MVGKPVGGVVVQRVCAVYVLRIRKVAPAAVVYLHHAPILQRQHRPRVFIIYRRRPVCGEQRRPHVRVGRARVGSVDPHANRHLICFGGVRQHVARQLQVVLPRAARCILEYHVKLGVVHRRKRSGAYNLRIVGCVKGVQVHRLGNGNHAFLFIYYPSYLRSSKLYVVNGKIVKHKSRVGVSPIPGLIAAQASVIQVGAVGKQASYHRSVAISVNRPLVYRHAVEVNLGRGFGKRNGVVVPLMVGKPVGGVVVQRVCAVYVLRIRKVAPAAVVYLHHAPILQRQHRPRVFIIYRRRPVCGEQRRPHVRVGRARVGSVDPHANRHLICFGGVRQHVARQLQVVLPRAARCILEYHVKLGVVHRRKRSGAYNLRIVGGVKGVQVHRLGQRLVALYRRCVLFRNFILPYRHIIKVRLLNLRRSAIIAQVKVGYCGQQLHHACVAHGDAFRGGAFCGGGAFGVWLSARLILFFTVNVNSVALVGERYSQKVPPIRDQRVANGGSGIYVERAVGARVAEVCAFCNRQNATAAFVNKRKQRTAGIHCGHFYPHAYRSACGNVKLLQWIFEAEVSAILVQHATTSLGVLNNGRRCAAR